MSNNATRSVSDSVLACVALTTGALFGMAAQAALRHFALDLRVIQDDLMLAWTGQTRSALAWWAWWLVGVAAFFVGRLSVVLMRYLAANWWLFREVRLALSAALVLGLAVVGHLRAASLSVDPTVGAALGAAVAATTALLSLLGARSAGASWKVGHRLGLEYGCGAAWAPVTCPPPLPGGGSVNSGVRRSRCRSGRRFLLEPGSLTRWALAGMMAVAVVVAVIAISGAAVLRDLVVPTEVNDLLAWDRPYVSRMTRPRASPMVMAAVPAPAVPAPEVPAPEVPPAVEIARPSAIVPIPESELTFSKGYAARRAAREAMAKLDLAPKTEVEPSTMVGSAAAGEPATVVQPGHGSAPHVAHYRRAQRDKAHADRMYARLADRRDGYDGPGDGDPGKRTYDGRENQGIYRRAIVRDAWRDRDPFGEAHQRMAALEDDAGRARRFRARDTDLFGSDRREPDRGWRQARMRSTFWH